MDKVIKFKNDSEIKILKPENPTLHSNGSKVYVTKEDLEMLWYLNTEYINELQST